MKYLYPLLVVILVLSSFSCLAEKITLNDTIACMSKKDNDERLFAMSSAIERASVRGKDDKFCQDFVESAQKISNSKCEQLSGKFTVKATGKAGRQGNFITFQVVYEGKKYWIWSGK
jgi:hypothetical protein